VEQRTQKRQKKKKRGGKENNDKVGQREKKRFVDCQEEKREKKKSEKPMGGVSEMVLGRGRGAPTKCAYQEGNNSRGKPETGLMQPGVEGPKVSNANNVERKQRLKGSAVGTKKKHCFGNGRKRRKSGHRRGGRCSEYKKKKSPTIP